MDKRIIRLGDYCNVIKGSTGIRKAIPGKYPLVVTAEERKSHNEFQFDATAVIIPLVSSTGHGHASIKRLHYQEGKFALGTILCAVLIKDTTIINPRFLYIYLSYFKDHLLVPLMKGAANVTLSITKVKDVEIILPPLERQLEILDLESNSDLIDELSFEIQTQKQLISQLKQAILQEAIEGKLTKEWREQNLDIEPASELLERIKAEKKQLIKEKKIKKEKPLSPISADEIPFEIPEGWVWCRLGEIALYLNGKGFNSSDFKKGNGVKCIKITNAGIGEIIPTDDTLPFNFKEKYPDYLVYENDIVIALTRPYIADGLKVSLCSKDYNESLLNQRVAMIKGVFVKNKYIYTYLRSSFVLKGYKDEFDSKGQQPNLKTEHITNLLVPLPPKEEQKAIVEKVEALMEKCIALEEEIITSEQHTNMLMQAVLKEAFENKTEQDTKVVKLNSKPTKIDYYKRILLAAEIVWQLHKEPTFGHLKLQKLIYLSQEVGNMKLPTNFSQQAAGPYDPQMARSLDKQMKTKKWFEYKKTELLKFKPLEKAGEHRVDFQKFFANERESIQYIMDTFKTAKSDQVEIVGTLYACWKKLIEDKQIISDSVLIKRFYEWSKEKERFEKDRLIKALRWMETKGIYPK